MRLSVRDFQQKKNLLSKYFSLKFHLHILATLTKLSRQRTKRVPNFISSNSPSLITFLRSAVTKLGACSSLAVTFIPCGHNWASWNYWIYFSCWTHFYCFPCGFKSGPYMAEKISVEYVKQALKQNAIFLMSELFVSISLILFWSLVLWKENGPKKK